MKLLRILLLASALAMPLAYSAVTITAEAAGKSKTAKPSKQAAYKSCGTFKYWKEGKCMDARSKK